MVVVPMTPDSFSNAKNGQKNCRSSRDYLPPENQDGGEDQIEEFDEQESDFDDDSITDDPPDDETSMEKEDVSGAGPAPIEPCKEKTDIFAEAKPIGREGVVVKQGDCISSIAYENGFFWKSIWNNIKNKSLKKIRQYPDVLMPGDRVFIPEKLLWIESCATETRHRFRRKGVPAMLRLVLSRAGEPLANIAWRLNLNGQWYEGTTDDEGMLKRAIEPSATSAVLIVDPENEPDEYQLDLGHVDPVDTTAGVITRLVNLGFEPGVPADKSRAGVLAAIRDFQTVHGLDPSGIIDNELIDGLARQHKS